VNPARGLLPLAGLLVAWQLAGDPRSVTLPPPSEWLAALVRLHDAGELLPAVVTTVSTAYVALVCAVLVGGFLGVLIGASPRADRLLTPALDVLATVPGAALIPLTILLLGITFVANVAVVALAVMWPVLLNATSAMRSIPAVRLDMARTLGLSAVGRWRKVVLPSLAPDVLVGIRVASSLSLILTLLVDILGPGSGIGIQLEIRSASFDAAGAWGLLLVVGTIGYLTSRAVAAVEGFVLRHRPVGPGSA